MEEGTEQTADPHLNEHTMLTILSYIGHLTHNHRDIKKRGHMQKHTPLEKKVLIMKLKLMVATVKTSRKTKTSVGSLWVSTAPLGLT